MLKRREGTEHVPKKQKKDSKLTQERMKRWNVYRKEIGRQILNVSHKKTGGKL